MRSGYLGTGGSVIKGTRAQAARDSHKKLIGERLRKARKGAGFTQKEFAKQLNISTSTLSLIESGEHVMAHSLDYYVKLICQELNLDVGEIIDG